MLEEQGAGRADRGRAQRAREGLAFEFLTGDFFDAGDDWLSATLLFVDCTCFRPKVMRRFCAMAEGLVDGAVVVSLTRCVAAGSDEFFELWQEQAKVSWGADARVRLREKAARRAALAGPAERRRRRRRGGEEPPTPTGPPALNAGRNVLLSSPMVPSSDHGAHPRRRNGLIIEQFLYTDPIPDPDGILLSRGCAVI